MAVEIQKFQATIPAGTPASNPLVSNMGMPARIVRRITVLVPPGPSGLVGFRLGSGGQQIIPITTGQWVIADDELLTWDVQGQIESGAWQLIAYNTGSNPHTLYVTFEVDPPQLAQSEQPLTLLTNAALSTPNPAAGVFVTTEGG